MEQTGEIAPLANVQDAEPASPISSAHVAEVTALVESGALNDRLARQVVEGAIVARGSRASVVAVRGLEVVSDDGVLIAAMDAALAQQPDLLEMIRDGKVQAAGAVIGAVLRSMGGKADATHAREPVLERAQGWQVFRRTDPWTRLSVMARQL